MQTLAAEVRAGKTKAADLVEKSLQAIKDKAEYNAIIVTLDGALAHARAAQIDKDPKVAFARRAICCQRQLPGVWRRDHRCL